MTHITIRGFVLWVCLLSLCPLGLTQEVGSKNDEAAESPYEVNRWISSGITLTGVLTNSFAHDRLRNKPDITEEYINLITSKGVNRFDRWGLRQDPSKKDEAAEASDRILYSSVLLPFILFFDKDIQKDWLDISLMYTEAQAINSNFYGWSPLGPTFVDRFRPALYYEELPLEERNYGNLRNSFYSGHVGSTATATFFAAKVFSDYHPNLGGAKFLLYGLAALPPALAGYYRIRALKHFPTDVIVGGAVGAFLGIIIPELHRKTKNKTHFSALYTREIKGMGMHHRF